MRQGRYLVARVENHNRPGSESLDPQAAGRAPGERKWWERIVGGAPGTTAGIVQSMASGKTVEVAARQKAKFQTV